MLATLVLAGWGIWTGVSAGTPTLIGKTEDVSFSFIAVRYSRVVVQRPAFNVRYTADLIPFARLDDVKGKGAAPLGAELSFRPGKRLEPTASLSGGFIYFDKDIPMQGKRFNFSADLGIGLRMHLGGPVGMHVGYKYHHLSNGNRATLNPGFDSNLMVMGLEIHTQPD